MCISLLQLGQLFVECHSKTEYTYSFFFNEMNDSFVNFLFPSSLAMKDEPMRIIFQVPQKSKEMDVYG